MSIVVVTHAIIANAARKTHPVVVQAVRRCCCLGYFALFANASHVFNFFFVLFCVQICFFSASTTSLLFSSFLLLCCVFIFACFFFLALRFIWKTQHETSYGKTSTSTWLRLRLSCDSTWLGLDWLVYNLYYINFSKGVLSGEVDTKKKQPDTSFEWKSIGLSTHCIAGHLVGISCPPPQLLPRHCLSYCHCLQLQANIDFFLPNSSNGSSWGSGSLLLLTVLPTAI